MLSCLKKVRKKIKSWDLFAVPVQLRYNGKMYFYTFIGGLCSIFMAVVVLGFGSWELLTMINEPTYLISPDRSSYTYTDIKTST